MADSFLTLFIWFSKCLLYLRAIFFGRKKFGNFSAINFLNTSSLPFAGCSCLIPMIVYSVPWISPGAHAFLFVSFLSLSEYSNSLSLDIPFDSLLVRLLTKFLSHLMRF